MKDEVHPTTKLIQDARSLLRPPEVLPYKLPPWLKKRLHKLPKGHPLRDLLLTIRRSMVALSLDWLDHWGSAPAGPFSCCRKGVNLVSEPYAFGAREAADVTRFCTVLGGGLVWHVSSDTWWYPGRTVRITIHEDRKEA